MKNYRQLLGPPDCAYAFRDTRAKDNLKPVSIEGFREPPLALPRPMNQQWISCIDLTNTHANQSPTCLHGMCATAGWCERCEPCDLCEIGYEAEMLCQKRYDEEMCKSG